MTEMKEQKGSGLMILIGAFMIAFAILLTYNTNTSYIFSSYSNLSDYTKTDGTQKPTMDWDFDQKSLTNVKKLGVEDVLSSETGTHKAIFGNIGAYVIGTDATYRGIEGSVMNSFFGSAFNGTMQGFYGKALTWRTNSGANIYGLVGYTLASDIDGGGYASKIVGTYGLGSGKADKVFGVSGEAQGTSGFDGDTCYSVYGATPTNCNKSWAGFFEGNVNVTGTLYYSALVSNSPHLLGEDETGYTRMIVTANDGKQLIQYWHYDKITDSYMLKAEPMNKYPSKYSKEIKKYNDFKMELLGKQKEPLNIFDDIKKKGQLENKILMK